MPGKILILGLVVLIYAGPAAAQGDRLSHSAYLRQTDLLETAAGIEQWLRDQLVVRRPDWPMEKRHQNAAFFAFILTVTGMTPETVASVDAQGVDVIHGITENSRPFIEQALLADVVLVGEVTASEPDLGVGDGFSFSDRVAVLRVLKGDVSGSTITVRRRSRTGPRDIVPEVGRQYLLLLSGGMYRFAAARHRAASADAASPGAGVLAGSDEPAARGDDAAARKQDGAALDQTNYSIYRIYEMADGRLLWNGFSREETAGAFEEIQLLDELIDAASRSSDSD